MTRDIDQLRQSRARLKRAAEEIQREIIWLEEEIRRAIHETPLNDTFFWRTLFPILASNPKGVTSSDLQRMLRTFGNAVNSNAFGTFLSRNKAKGRLTLDSSTTPARWRLVEGVTNPFGDDEP